MNAETEWLKYVMALPSIFPLAGALPKLRKFFPAELRSWYVTFSTIFSFIIYTVLQFSFETLEGFPIFVPFWATGLSAFLFLMIYIGLLRSVKRPLTSWKKSIFIIVTMALYILFVVNLTYAFNVLENMKSYYVIQGNIKSVKNEIPQVTRIEVKHNGSVMKTSYSKETGKFFFIIKKEVFEESDYVFFTTIDEKYWNRVLRSEINPNQDYLAVLETSNQGEMK